MGQIVIAVAAILIAASATLWLWPTESLGQGAEPPSSPTGLTGTVSHDEVALSWDDPDDPSITGYQILRRDKSIHSAGEFIVLLEDTGSAATSYTDTTVAPEGRYVFRVKARNSAGLSQRSRFFNANTPAAPEPVPEPTQAPEPTPEPTAEPTPEPTPEPTSEPTPEPTAEPTQAPEPTPEVASQREPEPDTIVVGTVITLASNLGQISHPETWEDVSSDGDLRTFRPRGSPQATMRADMRYRRSPPT